jgi:hypothetical protein
MTYLTPRKPKNRQEKQGNCAKCCTKAETAAFQFGTPPFKA